MKPIYVAFYLPQFYPFPENDAWWGKGFTEWTNVTKAVPLFDGHYQPHLPTELSFYDLRVRETQHEQIALAQQYGVDAFCFHYYWFSGKRLLDKPVDAFLVDKSARMPFCLSWANENWTRRWDGAEQQMLISQDYESGYEKKFVESIAPFLRDDRYLRVDGRPVLIVYRPQQIPNPAQSVKKCREHCRKIGLGEIHLVAALTHGNFDYEALGFDAGVEFPPHNMMVENVNRDVTPFETFSGMFVDYSDVARDFLGRDHRGKKIYRTVVPSWDNTARLGGRAVAMLGATPDNYERWLRAATSRTVAERTPAERLVFINAWNEWAEGCHLEPDRKFGRAFLDATLRVKEGRSVLDDVFDLHPFRKAENEEKPLAVSSSTIWAQEEPTRRFLAFKLKTQSLLSSVPIAYQSARFCFRSARAAARQIRSIRGRISVSKDAPPRSLKASLPFTLETVPLGRSARQVQDRTELLAEKGDAILTAYRGRTVTSKSAEVTAGCGATKQDRLIELFAEKSFEAVPLQFGRFVNCVAHSRAIGVITQGGRLIEESIRVYRYVYKDLDFLRYLEEDDGKYVLLSNKFESIDEEVILPMHSSFAFGHVIFDVIPQILFWEGEIKQGRLKVVLPNDAPLWVRSILATWGFLPHHFLILPHTPYRFRSAIVCNGLTTNTTYYPNPDAMAQYAAQPTVPSISGKPALIYLTRDHSNTYSDRFIDNEADVISTLEALGFAVVDPSAYPYSEQIELFRNAKIIVGAHGSAFANVIWCRPGTKLVDVMPDDWVGFWNDYGITEMWLSRASSLFALDYEVLLCKSRMVEGPFPGQPHLTKREITSQVDTDALSRRVRNLIKAVGQ
ncbi:glycoside hydrolase family 99-like domain-containing protein [Mesorhizobium sp. CA10]|uniref:glycoside hydrolase family 99-like domain-containing protein n=1 Tax=Mesorhizobium sp. CA10 TaxID=588495 RepID=UPI001CCF75AE|nr:glycoside hydrolase family 99-like domain-containing protein [Mesorhizobium sp. CA10]MBZ9883167.1 glycoside hydrolase family 99-like domain-containing protein [Mesorhizobium sp. CA10]